MIRRTALFAGMLSLSLAACTSPQVRQATVEGDWALTSATLGGKELPLASFGGLLRLHGGNYVFQNDSGSYVLLEGKPRAMDVLGAQGPNAGKTIPAIYRLDGDAITICYDLSGKARPVEFKSAAGTLQFLAVYARVQ